MAHGRQQIRDAAVSAVTGLPITGSNVYSGRAYRKVKLPCLSVYTPTEAASPGEDLVMGSTKQERTLVLEIVATAKKRADIDDYLDDICADVEAAIAADATLAGLVKTIAYVGTEIELTGELEDDAGNAAMRWEVVYRVDQADPETIIS